MKVYSWKNLFAAGLVMVSLAITLRSASAPADWLWATLLGVLLIQILYSTFTKKGFEASEKAERMSKIKNREMFGRLAPVAVYLPIILLVAAWVSLRYFGPIRLFFLCLSLSGIFAMLLLIASSDDDVEE